MRNDVTAREHANGCRVGIPELRAARGNPHLRQSSRVSAMYTSTKTIYGRVQVADLPVISIFR